MSRIRFDWPKSVTKSSLSPTTRLVLLTLATFMNERGSCFPSHSTIAARSGLSTRAVGKHMAIAEKCGWLRVCRRSRGSKQSACNSYTAVCPTGSGENPTAQEFNDDRNLATNRPESSNPATRNTVPTNNPINIASNTHIAKKFVESEDFDALWEAFPRHPDSKKLAGYFEWKKLPTEGRNDCLAAAVAFAITFKTRKPPSMPNTDVFRSAPHLSTWLRRRSWTS